MENKHESFKLASYTTENKQAGRIIEVSIWNEVLEQDSPIVTIATDQGVLTLSIQDVPWLISSLTSIINKCIDISLIKCKFRKRRIIINAKHLRIK